MTRSKAPDCVDSTCAFCKIIGGEQNGYKVLEDDNCIAFLDRRPLFPGHSLLVPRYHYETMMDLPADLIRPLFTNAQLLTSAMEQVLGAEGSFVAINNRISQSVPHLHVHIVPRKKKDGLKGFFWPRQSYKDEGEMRRVQQELQSGIASLKIDL